MKPDFWELKETPGVFGSHNDAAGWIQAHKDDPYWMAHQLYNAANECRPAIFSEYWKMAREIKGYENT